MLINQHRKYTPTNIIFVCIVGCILCLGAFYHLPTELEPVYIEPAMNNLIQFDIGIGLSPKTNVIVTLILTLFQAFLLNKTISNYNFFNKPNFLTALLYMTLVSLFLPFLILSPTLICNFITIWMLNKLFDIYKQNDVKGLMFDLGIIVALGSLIYFPFIVMLLLLWIALIIFRPFIWREWLTPILGFFNVYFLVAIAYYWFGRFDEFKAVFSPLTNPLPTSLPLEQQDYIVLIPIGIALLFFISILKDQYFKSIVQIRKSFQLLFYMILLIFASFYLTKMVNINHFLLCAPPFAIYLGYYFTYAKTKWLYESLYLLIIGLILYFQFI